MTNGEKYVTAKERAEAFRKFCMRDNCDRCEFHQSKNRIECAFNWLNLLAEDEKPLPCPFCKHPQVRVYADESKKRVYCPECGFTMPWRGLSEDVYDEYNRVAKKCREAKE